MEIINIVILVCLVLIVPIIPAYLLYKTLPSPTNVSGPWKGLNIQLTGAFAGYFILALLASGLVYYCLDKTSQYKLWNIEGKIVDTTGKGLTGVMLTVIPPNQNQYPNGSFNIRDFPLEKSMSPMPGLIIQKEGYTNMVIPLNDQRYEIKHDPSKKTISIIRDIVLPSAPGYDPEQGAIPKRIP